ncbi:hypothetical protein [Mycobacterium sp. URHB0021]
MRISSSQAPSLKFCAKKAQRRIVVYSRPDAFVPDIDTALFELCRHALSGLAGAADDENGVSGLLIRCVAHGSKSTA